MKCNNYIIVSPITGVDQFYSVFLDLSGKVNLNMKDEDVAKSLFNLDNVYGYTQESIYNFCLEHKDRFLHITELTLSAENAIDDDNWDELYNKVYNSCLEYEITPDKLLKLMKK